MPAIADAGDLPVVLSLSGGHAVDPVVRRMAGELGDVLAAGLLPLLLIGLAEFDGVAGLGFENGYDLMLEVVDGLAGSGVDRLDVEVLAAAAVLVEEEPEVRIVQGGLADAVVRVDARVLAKGLKGEFAAAFEVAEGERDEFHLTPSISAKA
jgi:hypothetical protein